MGPRLAVDLINSYALDPTYAEPELLRTPTDLAAILAASGAAWDGPLGEAELAAARSSRAELRRVFEGGSAEERTRHLETLVLAALPRIMLRDEHVHIELAAPTKDFGQWLVVEAALGLAEFLEAYGFARLGICQADPCRDVYADATLNRSRRYCSVRCSNRLHSARHRQRHSTQSPRSRGASMPRTRSTAQRPSRSH